MLNNTSKLITINVIAHLLLIPGIIYGTWYMWVLSFLWWQLIVATSISAGYHRYFSHKSFKTHKLFEIYFQLIGIFANAGPVLTWASSHKMHHAYSDTPHDPHSPVYKTFFSVYFNTWGYNIHINRRFLKSLITNTSVVFFYKHYFKIFSVIATSMLLINPLLLIFGLAVPIVIAFHGYGLINAYTHKTGQATNNTLVNFITAGEGQHATHHKYHRKSTIGTKWYHFDTGAIFINIIKHD